MGEELGGLTGVVPMVSRSSNDAVEIVLTTKAADDKALALFFILNRHKQGTDLTLWPKDAVEMRFAADNPQDILFQRTVLIEFSLGMHTCELWLLDLNEQVPLNHRPPSAPPGTSVCKWEVKVE